jgi:hypothetical protein
VAQSVKRFDRFVNLADHRFQPAMQSRTSLSQADAPCRPLKKEHAKPTLKTTDCLADRLDAQSKVGGCPGETCAFGDNEERRQAFKGIRCRHVHCQVLIDSQSTLARFILKVLTSRFAKCPAT